MSALASEAFHRSLSYKLSGMKREQRQNWQPGHKTAKFLCLAGLVLVMLLSPAAAQDIRGMEVCTAEKQMERRTACLQANVEFLQQALLKLARETQEKMAAADRDLATARAEIAALKSTLEKLNSELKQMKAKAEPESKK
jgi:septal ring factor EnvC (AmiA/AmiB activator)